jgi:alpha-tubulin suppressor-like RCC1 family protein
VTAWGNGTATITATADGGKKTTCLVTVTTPVIGVELNRGTMTLNPGGSSAITAMVLPETASDKTVIWSSSNEAVATVEWEGNGLTATVTAIGAGAATITAASVDNPTVEAFCGVTVEAGSSSPAHRTLSEGSVHQLAIKADGSLWAWGSNSEGQLGLGDSGEGTNRNVPTKVGVDNDWVAVAGGTRHSLALKRDGSLWAWGQNTFRQLGLGDTASRNIPTKVGADTDWASVSSYSSTTMALKTDGSLWAWGRNIEGQLGIGSISLSSDPVRVGAETDSWAVLNNCANYSFAIKEDSSLWAWGDNGYGWLGLGDTSSKYIPTIVGADYDWAAASGSYYHSAGIKIDGSLWVWGGAASLGLGAVTSNQLYPVQLGVDGDWASVSPSFYFTLAIKTDGGLWGWGRNESAQLGDGTRFDRSAPIQVGNNTKDWVAVAPGTYGAVALKADGSLWSWGDSGYGYTGIGNDTGYVTSPTKISDGWRLPAK